MAEKNVKINLTGISTTRANNLENWLTNTLPGVIGAHSSPITWMFERDGDDINVELAGEGIRELLLPYRDALRNLANNASLDIEIVNITTSRVRTPLQLAAGGDVE